MTILLGLPILAATVALFITLNLKQYQGLFLLSAGLHLLLAYFLLPNAWPWVVLAVVVAEVAHFVAIGMGKEGIFLSWYKALLALGLFPWYWSWTVSGVFIATMVFTYLLLLVLQRTKGFVPSSPPIIGAGLIGAFITLGFIF